MTERKTTTRRRATARVKAEQPEVEESAEVAEAGADDAPEQDADTSQDEQADDAPEAEQPEQPEQDERPDVPACIVTELPDDLVHVQPVSRADTPAVAALLLQHTEQPGAVRTVTAPEGWLVPATVAKSAGVGT